MSSEKVFVAGLYFKNPHTKAPDYVIGNLSAKREELIAFLKLQTDEWVNMVIKEAKSGKPYIQIDDWKPSKKTQDEENKDDEDSVRLDGAPF